MHSFDTSSIIHGWDAYPIELFPALWDWIDQRIQNRQLAISQVAFDELGPKSAPCNIWLKDRDIERVPISGKISTEAIAIRALLGITGDDYHPNGVSENDILIVAAAKITGHTLVSNEARQPSLPANMARYKIPAVCQLGNVSET